MQLILNNSIFANFKTLADGTLRLTIDLQEINNVEMSELMDFFRKRGIHILIDSEELDPLTCKIASCLSKSSHETIEKVNEMLNLEKLH